MLDLPAYFASLFYAVQGLALDPRLLDKQLKVVDYEDRARGSGYLGGEKMEESLATRKE